jgi:hypothetical protein
VLRERQCECSGRSSGNSHGCRGGGDYQMESASYAHDLEKTVRERHWTVWLRRFSGREGYESGGGAGHTCYRRSTHRFMQRTPHVRSYCRSEAELLTRYNHINCHTQCYSAILFASAGNERELKVVPHHGRTRAG